MSIKSLDSEISLAIPLSCEFTIILILKKIKMLSWCNFFQDSHFKTP